MIHCIKCKFQCRNSVNSHFPPTQCKSCNFFNIIMVFMLIILQVKILHISQSVHSHYCCQESVLVEFSEAMPVYYCCHGETCWCQLLLLILFPFAKKWHDQPNMWASGRFFLNTSNSKVFVHLFSFFIKLKKIINQKLSFYSFLILFLWNWSSLMLVHCA